MKKTISIVLVLALILGSFSMAFAAEGDKTVGLSDISDSANAKAIEVVNSLGIVKGYEDGTFKPAQNVTRAEFAAMITRALAISESVLAPFNTTTFTDTTGYAWAVKYLGYCDSKGIIKGYGDGTVKPGNTINVNEAITMVCRAIGYVDGSSELIGTWPSNYVALANSLRLYTSMTATAEINRENAAQLIFNALSCPMVYSAANGVTTKVQVDNKDVTMMSLLGGAQANGGKAFVLTPAQASEAAANVSAFVGAYVKAYVDADDKIIAVEQLSTFITGKYDKKGGTFKSADAEYYIDEAVIKTAKEAKNLEYKPQTVTNGAAKEGFDLADGDKTTLAVSVSGKTIKEIYSRTDWSGADIFQYKTGMISTKGATINTNKFAKNDNGEIDTESFALIGVNSLDDIKAGDVVEVYKEAKNNTITRIVVGTKTVSGTADKVDGDDYYINNTAYTYVGDAAKAPVLGQTGVAYLNYAGEMMYWSVTTADMGNYGIFLGSASKTEFGETVVTVKILTKDNKENTLTVRDKLNDTATKIKENSIVTFAVNSEGKVSALVDQSSKVVSVNGNLNNKGTIIGTTAVADDVTVFIKTDDGKWEAGSIDRIDRDVNLSDASVGAKGIKVDGKWAVITAPESVYTMDVRFGVVVGNSVQVHKNDSKYYQIETYVNGKAMTIEVPATGEGKTPYAITKQADKLQAITFSMDADATIKNVETVVKGTGKNQAYDIKTGTIESADITAKQVTLGDSVYGLADGVVVYLWNAETEKYEVAENVLAAKGKTADLYQMTEKSDGFDFIVAW